MTAGAYPIPPQTLWDLTASNELVVLARVETTRHEGVLRRPDGVPCAAAFPEGRHVVAFLAKDDGA